METSMLGTIFDLAAARSGISRDLREVAEEGVLGWAALSVVFALPAASVLLLACRPLARAASASDLVLELAAWFRYYATDWWSNEGQGVWAPAMAVVLLGWFLVAVELWRLDREQQ